MVYPIGSASEINLKILCIFTLTFNYYVGIKLTLLSYEDGVVIMHGCNLKVLFDNEVPHKETEWWHQEKGISGWLCCCRCLL